MVSLSGRSKSARHKEIDELAREQGVADERPDYIALFSKVWRTREEAAAFRRYIRSIRRPSKS